MKNLLKKWWFWVIVVFVIGYFGSLMQKPKATMPTSTTSKALSKEEIAKSKEHDSFASLAKEGNKKIDFINEIKGSLENLKIYQNTFYGDNFKSYSPVEILNVLNNWTATYNNIYNSTDNEILEYKTEYYKLLSKALKTNYPALRKYFAKFSNDKMWEHNWEISSLGSGNKEIRFIAAVFANNANVKEAYQNLKNQLSEFRFKKASFLWFKSAPEYTYYDIDSKSDLDDIKNLK
ncbi:hypothetical protein KAZ01_02975 [Candidatus Gracilibacteria bacterium]|nr:hypothetical protein [Candidatus Gracilibacteria bacterium]